MRNSVRTILSLALAGFTLPAFAQGFQINPADVKSPAPEYSPYLEHNYPDRVYFGDTHVHTSFSTDAGLTGTRLGPDEAYRFAMGEEVTASLGVRARLQRPLDFLVVADHAENLGLAPLVDESSPDLLKTEFGRRVHGLVKAGQYLDAYRAWGEGMYRDRPLSGLRGAGQRCGTCVARVKKHQESRR